MDMDEAPRSPHPVWPITPINEAEKHAIDSRLSNKGLTQINELVNQKITTRDYQNEAIDRLLLFDIEGHWQSNGGSPAIVLPTGTGKGNIIFGLAVLASKGLFCNKAGCRHRVLIVEPLIAISEDRANAASSSPRAEILGGLNLKHKRIVRKDIGNENQVTLEALALDVDGNIFHCNYQGFRVKAAEVQEELEEPEEPLLPLEGAEVGDRDFFCQIIFDEGHHVAAPSWQKIKKRYSGALCSLFTAFDRRADKRPLGAVPVLTRSLLWAAENGFVKKPVVVTLQYSEEVMAVVEGQPHVLSPEEIEALSSRTDLQSTCFNSNVVRGDLIKCGLRILADQRRKTGTRHIAMFCAKDIESGDRLTEKLKSTQWDYLEAGSFVKAEFVHSGLSQADIDKIKRMALQGDLDVVVQCNLLAEGWDCPLVSVVVLCHKYTTPGILIQHIGRGFRIIQNYASDNQSDTPYRGGIRKDAAALGLPLDGDLNLSSDQVLYIVKPGLCNMDPLLQGMCASQADEIEIEIDPLQSRGSSSRAAKEVAGKRSVGDMEGLALVISQWGAANLTFRTLDGKDAPPDLRLGVFESGVPGAQNLVKGSVKPPADLYNEEQTPISLLKAKGRRKPGVATQEQVTKQFEQSRSNLFAANSDWEDED